MMKKDMVKAMVLESGADQCDIADVERFSAAPEGFRPRDIYGSCKAVIVFLKGMPGEIIKASNPIPYSHAASLIF